MPASIRHLKELFSKDHTQIVLFAKWPANNLYYQVSLLKLDEKKEKCFVKYEDDVECWVNRRDVHIQFSSSDLPYSDTDDIFCCLCGGSTSNEPNQIILCDVCQQGYHQECHQPRVRQAEIEDEANEWPCQTCSYILKQLDPMPNTSTPKMKPRRIKDESPRRSIFKARTKKKETSAIKLKLINKEKANKKSSQESVPAEPVARVKTKQLVPVVSEDESSFEEPAPGDTSEESPMPPPPTNMPDGSTIENGDKNIVAAAKTLVSSIGTSDFVDAIAEKAGPAAKATKAKAINGKATNGKIPRKVPAKKAAKAPVPPA